MDFDRLKLLEQKVIVMQEEINAVLSEVQQAMSLLARSSKMALEALQNQIDQLRKDIPAKPAPKDPDVGREL